MVAILYLLLTAQDFAGAKACAVCHSEIAAPQAGTHHAGALKPETKRWAFGSGAQAITYVSQVNEDTYLEHGLSWYKKTGSTALTPGHRSATGVTYSTFASDAALLRCFQCHSTGKLQLTAGRAIQPAELGVRCEACHGAGSAHTAAPARTNIVNPRRLTAVQVNDLCGQCHRMPLVAANFENAWNVRHQPVYLSQSACFLKSGGQLSCLSCHGPHEDRPAVANCSGCHAKPKHTANVSNATCVSCHMPLVRPSPLLGFTNHWIGVYRLTGPDANVLRPLEQRPGR